jgi:TrmH family RNA methyltransferase
MTSASPLSREKLKTLRSLSSTKIRRRKGVCLVEGERAIEEAARSGNLIYLVLSVKDLAGETPGILAARYPDIPVYSLEDRHFYEITDISSGTGILGAASIPPGSELDNLSDDMPRSIVVYLDGLQEPGNVGGIIRTAWALGISGVMLGKGTSDPFSAKGVRASAGGVFHVPVFYGVGIENIRDLMGKGYSIFLAEAGGSDLQEIHFPVRSVLALGSEAHGFSDQIRKLGRTVGIAMVPGVDSLNVVVAGSIILERMKNQ